ncbi:hypothetical protein ACHAWT_006616 [Skeletonema menzelii]
MDHQAELDSIKAEADAKLELLQDELLCNSETIESISAELSDARKEFNDLKAKAAANEQNARSNRNAQQKEIQRLVEENSVQAKNVLRLEQSLVTLRNELTEGNMKKIENLRAQLSRSHAQEIDLLKSRHESHVREAAELALEQEELAVDNAVTKVKLEYEAKLSQQLDVSSKELQLVEAKLNDEINSLQRERNELKLVADKVPSLRRLVECHVENERKLGDDLASRQDAIADLESRNMRLNDIVQKTCQALKDLSTKAEAMEGEINTRNDLVKSLESELAEVKQSSSEQLERTGLQLLNKNEAITKLEASLSQSESLVANLEKQLDEMRGEIIELSKFKEFTTRTASTITDLNADVALCKNDSQEMAQLLSSSLEEIASQMQRKDVLHSKEVSKLEESTAMLRDELSRLLSEVDESERANDELVERISSMEAAASDAETAISAERLSWERSMADIKATMSREKLSWVKAREEMKATYQKEQATLCIRAQDEQDILNNQIVMLRGEMKKQQERNECKLNILQTESLRNIEALNAAMSKIKYDDAAEIQELVNMKSGLTKRLEEKEHECTSLFQRIESIKVKHHAEVESLNSRHKEETETAFQSHMSDLMEQERVHQGKVGHLEQRFEEEKESYVNHFRDQLTTGRETILGAMVGMREELEHLRALSTDEMVKSKQHFRKLVFGLQERYNSRLKECSDKIAQLELLHSEAMTALKEKSHQRVALAKKDLRETKQILFSTVQESETKLETTVRRLEEEHALKLKDAKAKKAADLIDALSKVKNLSKQCEALTQKYTSKTNEVTQRDEKIAQHEEEVAALKLAHTKERRRLLRDALAKETTLTDQFAKERSELKQKLLDAKEESQKIHEKYKAKGEVHEQIRALQKQMQMLEVSERDAKDKLLRLQQQMENEKKKESAVLRTIQSTRSPSSRGSGASKLRSSSTSAMMKSRRVGSGSDILPRVHRRQNNSGRSISKSLR